MSKPLAPKRALFVKEYLVDKNGTRAAIAAGYSEKTAGSIASELLTFPEVREAIDRGLADQKRQAEKRAARRGITRERWLRELELIGFSNYDDFAVMEGGKLRIKDTAERKKHLGRVVKKISQSISTSSGEKCDSDSISQAIELHDKTKALVLIGQAHGWLTQKVEHTGKVTLEELVAGSLHPKGEENGEDSK